MKLKSAVHFDYFGDGAGKSKNLSYRSLAPKTAESLYNFLFFSPLLMSSPDK